MSVWMDRKYKKLDDTFFQCLICGFKTTKKGMPPHWRYHKKLDLKGGNDGN